MVDGVGRDVGSCSQVVVSGITGNVTVQSVAYNGFSHSFIGDLQLALYTPLGVQPPAGAGSRVLVSPPDARACNFVNANIVFIDTAASSIDAASAGCTDATNLPSGSYRTSGYGGGTANGTVDSLAVTPGVLTPAQANGTWNVCAYDFPSAGGDTSGGTVASVAITLVGPTAAGVDVSGRVLSSDGRGVRNAVVTMSDTNGVTRSVISGPNGAYRFADVEGGRSYTIGVSARRFNFTPVVVQITDNLSELNFIAEGNGMSDR